MNPGTAEGPIDIAELDRLFSARLERELQSAERERAAEPAAAMLWAALAPGWTPALARGCGFPSVEGGLESFFERAVERGFVERRRAAGQGSGPFYVMSPAQRSRVLDAPPADVDTPGFVPAIARSLNRFGGGRPEWRRAAAEIGLRMAKAPDLLPPALGSWARLAVLAGDPAALVDGFDRMVRDAAQQRDSAAVLDLIDAARPLAALAARDRDDRLLFAIQRAGRRLELLHRRAMDEQHLRLFLRRGDQIEAVERLLAGSGHDPWALHFIGAGGVGKTMLMRYLSVQLATPREQRQDFDRFDAVAARVDFDYLNADYPSLAPGLLLWALAQDLRAFDFGGGAAELFDQADRAFEEVHQSLRASASGLQGPATAHPLFARALTLWADALRRLDRQVLLIIDTCEELGRLRPDGRALANVEETFRILEALHDGVETLDGEPGRGGVGSLRVVFSGRRPLAAGGSDWRCAGAAALLPRAYLRLHQLRGFTQDEAHAYLDRGGAPAALRDAIVTASSPDAGSAVQIEWDDARSRPVDVPRCNPYELRLNLDWALEDPPPTAEEIAAATSDQYVELRILRRLHDEALERALPAAALLGHFDRALLDAACGGEAADTAFDHLAAQEWTSARSGTVAGQALVLDLDGGVRRRLRAYFARRGAIGVALRERARRHLEQATIEGPLAALDWSAFDAALSAFEHDPDAGTRWWSRVEARLFAERDPDWVVKLTEPLLGADGACGESEPGGDALPPHPLRAFVLATHAAALAHAGSTQLALSGWETVAALAGADSASRRALALRAHAARLALLWPLHAQIDAGVVASYWRRVDALDALDSAQQLVSLVAAAEALIERAERPLDAAGFDPGDATSFVHLARLAVALEQADAARVAEPAAIACSLAGRALRRSPDASIDAASAREAVRWLLESIRLADRALQSIDPAAPPPAWRWLDWVAPDNVAARVRLEFVRAACPAWLAPAEVVALTQWSGGVANADEERLASALLVLRLASGPVAAGDLAPLGWGLSATLAPVPRADWPAFARVRHAAHLDTAPLVVTVARAWAVAGAPQAALDQLAQVIESGRHRDPLAHRAALLERLRLAVQWRLDDVAQRLLDDAPSDLLADDPLLIQALVLVSARSRGVPAAAVAAPAESTAADSAAAATSRNAARAGMRELLPSIDLDAAALAPGGVIGERAAAEIALREGALLGAAGADANAIAALARACDGFERAGDRLGGLLAAALLALYVPERDHADALARLRRGYEACGAALGLPDWATLEAATVASDGAASDVFGTAVWDPWLTRMVAAISGSMPARGTALAQWVRARWPAPAAAPAEWRRWIERHSPSVGAAPEAAEAATAAASPTAGRWGYGLLGFGVLGLLLGGLFWLFRRGATWVAPSFADLGIGAQVLIFLGVLVALGTMTGGVGSVRRRWAAWRASLGWIELGIDRPAPGDATPATGARLTLRRVEARFDWRGSLHPRFAFWPVVHAAGLPQVFPVLPAPLRPGDLEPWAKSAPQLAAALRGRFGEVGTFGLDVVLRVDFASHLPDWEAMLVQAAGVAPGRLASLRPRRVVTAPSADTVRSAEAGAARIAVLAEGEVARGVVQAAWRGVRAAEAAVFEGDGQRVGVVHAIGRVERTGDGLRLRIGDAYAATSKASLEAMVRVREWPARSFALAQVCIVQAPPVPALRSRLESDRDAAGLARAFGAEIAAAGVPLVVVLPPQRPDEAARAVAELARIVAAGAGARAPDSTARHRLAMRIDDRLARLRQRIATMSDRESAGECETDALARALDACFFSHYDPAP